MRDLGGKVRLPPAEVVIHVNHWNLGTASTGFELPQAPGHRDCEPEEIISFRKIEVVNNVNNQQGGIGVIRRGAMQRLILYWHGGRSGTKRPRSIEWFIPT